MDEVGRDEGGHTILIIIVIALILIVVFMASMASHAPTQRTETKGEAGEVGAPPPERTKICEVIVIKQPQTRFITFTVTTTKELKVIKDKIVVDPLSYVYVKFTLPRDVTLEGFFKARGGLKNDIKVIVLDGIQLMNFKNNNPYKAYYVSGKVTADQFAVELKAGEYYIIFDNTFSLLSNKVVDVDVSAKWLETIRTVKTEITTLTTTTTTCR